MEKRICKTCLMPSDYIGISMDTDGRCTYCTGHKPRTYLGKAALLERIAEPLSRNMSDKYDCVVGFSGGRDSTYLLWYVVHELKLRPLAVFADDMFIPQQMLENIQETTRVLGVDLVTVRHPYLKNCVKHHLNAWIKRPVAGSLICLNTGERLGYLTLVEQEAVKHGVKLIFSGGSPFQQESYKSDVVKLHGMGLNGKPALIMGWMKQMALNPALGMSYTALKTQYLEFTNAKRRRELLQKHKIVQISPYFDYIHWKEKEVEAVLAELNWKSGSEFKSTCRVGCEMDTLRQYLFYRILGYNDKNVTLSEMIRDGQITRDEGLRRISGDQEIPDQIVSDILDKAGVDSARFIAKLNQVYPR